MYKYFDAAKVEATVAFDVRKALSPFSRTSLSAIDRYYERADGILSSARSLTAQGSVDLLPLMFLRLISATESYFREILAGLPAISAEIRKHSAKENISLGSSYHYAPGDYAFATLEHVSFCTKDEIGKQTKRVTGFICAGDSSLRTAIEKFEQISQLRHAVIHSFDEVSFNNLHDLGLNGTDAGDRYRVAIDQLVFQDFVAICHSVVRAYNRALLDHSVSKWIEADGVRRSWALDKERFEKICKLFVSHADMGARNNFHRYQSFISRLAPVAGTN